MAETAGKPLAGKLGLRPGQRACFLNLPPGGLPALEEALQTVVQKPLSGGDLDVVHVFETSRAALEARFPELKSALAIDGMLWVSWPKRSAKIPTDLDENRIREIGLRSGLVDVKVCAVDETWSALKFVYRVKDR